MSLLMAFYALGGRALLEDVCSVETPGNPTGTQRLLFEAARG